MPISEADHLEPVRKRIRAVPISPPQPTWFEIVTHAVGGLTEVGFADDADLLLVVSGESLVLATSSDLTVVGWRSIQGENGSKSGRIEA